MVHLESGRELAVAAAGARVRTRCRGPSSHCLVAHRHVDAAQDLDVAEADRPDLRPLELDCQLTCPDDLPFGRLLVPSVPELVPR